MTKRTTHSAPSSTHNSPEPSTFTDSLPLPKLLVFDLDYTLWPFWVDTHPSPPFHPLTGTRAGTAAKDRSGREYGFYREVPSVLAAARRRGVPVAAASRTCAPEDARQLLGLLTIGVGGEDDGRKKAEEFFADMQIFPGNKVAHMQKLRRALGVEYEDMLFFDDESRNRNVERELGVRFVFVRGGVTRAVVDEGVSAWRKGRGVDGVDGVNGRGEDVEREGLDVVMDD